LPRLGTTEHPRVERLQRECDDHTRGRAYVRELRDYIRSIDPGRLVTFADDSLPRVKNGTESASQDADFVMVNEYFGSWAGPAEQLGPVLDRIGAFYPDKMVIIAEFGLAGFFEPEARKGDEHRIRIMRDQLSEFARRDWIAGAIFWCYQDYKSHRNLWPGLTKGYVDMGWWTRTASANRRAMSGVRRTRQPAFRHRGPVTPRDGR